MLATTRPVAVLLSVMLLIASCKKKSEDAPAPPAGPVTVPVVVTGDNNPVLFGNPTNAEPTSSFTNNYLKSNGTYIIGYHAGRGTSMWVAWHLESGDLGSAPRQDDFRPDNNLPAGFYKVQDNSYSGSGFDRGHNCPSADRTLTIPANSSTFLMTNMVPQAPNMNQGPWDGLETFIRNTLVGTTKEAFIVMGNAGKGGYNSSGTFVNTIDGGRVTVPKKIWKVVLLLPKGTNDLARIDTSATVLVVNMLNDNGLYSTSGTGHNAWRNYLTTVSLLEADANSYGDYTLDLFKGIPEPVKSYLKAKLYQ